LLSCLVSELTIHSTTFFFTFRIVSFNIWAPQAPSTIVFIGTYSGDGPTDSKGIYAFELDETKPALTPLGLSVETTNASYVLVHPSRQYLYAVNEQDQGTVTAFRIDPNQRGRLHLINQQSSQGSGPCYLSTNRFGDYIFVANYNNGTVAVLPIDINNGSLRQSSGFDQQNGSSIDPVRQTSPHAHCILLDRREEYALSADLGSDQIYHYRFDPSRGSIERTEITKAGRPGDGPRHVIFNFNERFVYVMNELKSEITVFRYFPNMEPVQIISSLPENYTLPNTGAEILLHPITGRYLYASNRGHDSVAVFTVDIETGTLSLIQHISVQGQTPRNFNISPNGRFLIVANQNSHNVVLFTIDEQTGKLTATGSSVQVSSPTCVKYLFQETI
jgi:6-phosphogluconolactonase